MNKQVTSEFIMQVTSETRDLTPDETAAVTGGFHPSYPAGGFQPFYPNAVLFRPLPIYAVA